jgi:RNA polymerase sigma-70 factor (ECF subfamily)
MSRAGEARAASAAPGPCSRAFETELDFVYRSLRRHGVARADAEDLTQDVFVIMWRRWGDYDDERPLRPWLAGITYKVAHRHVSRSRRFLPQAEAEMPDPRPGQDDQLATARALRLLARALDQLNPHQRAVVVMHDLDGVSMREVAAHQAVPLFTAYTRLRSGRRNLAEAIAGLRGREGARGATPAAQLPALLALEREATDLSTDARERLLARARTAARGPAPETPAIDEPTPPLGPAWTVLALAGGVVAAVLVAPALWPRGDRGARLGDDHAARAAHDPTSPARVLAPAVPVPRGFVVPAAAPPAPGTKATSAPVGRWSFDEARGSSSASDLSGNGHDCQLRRNGGGADPDGAWTEGVVGGALALDGRHWLECPRFDRQGRIDGELTIALWMKVGAVSGKHVLVTRQFGTTGDRLFSLRLRNGSVELLSHVWEKVLRRPYPRAGLWTHVAAVRELHGTSLYLDGVLVGRSSPSSPRPLGGAGTPLLIGGLINGPEAGGRAFHLLRGALDELVLYDRALTAEEIRALAAPPAPHPEPPARELARALDDVLGGERARDTAE